MPIGLQYGLTVFDFWNMTLKEITLFIQGIQKQENMKRQDYYLQASLIANFIGFVINGKPIPPIHQVFPELYQEEQIKQEKEEREYKAMMLYKEQMLDYANALNKRNKAKRNGENK